MEIKKHSRKEGDFLQHHGEQSNELGEEPGSHQDLFTGWAVVREVGRVMRTPSLWPNKPSGIVTIDF